MNKKIIYMAQLILLLGLFNGCTDLNETVFSDIEADEDFYNDPDAIKLLAAPRYDELLRLMLWNYWVPVEVNSDECMIPARGTGWYDGGVWVRNHLHQITVSGMAGWNMQTYRECFGIVSATNNTLIKLDEEKALMRPLIAESKVIRAIAYFVMMDVYGDVPLVTDKAFLAPGEYPEKVTRKEIFDFLVEELTWSAEYLPEANGGEHPFPRFTKASAHALLAKVYINGSVYTGSDSYNGKSFNDLAIEQCDAVLSLNSNLASDYFDLFKADNLSRAANESLIFFDTKADVYQQFNRSIFWVRGSLPGEMHGSLPRYDVNTSFWGGISYSWTLLDKFDDADIRKKGLLVGPQYNSAGEVVIDIDPVVPDLVDGSDNMNKGARIDKWEPDPNTRGDQQHQGWPFVRVADIMLLKAEATIRKSGPNAVADALVNQVRERAFDPDRPLTGVTLEEIYDERGRELYTEGWRRNDQIRFGKFLEPCDLKGQDVDEHGLLWPFQPTDLQANPNLTQNPGY